VDFPRTLRIASATADTGNPFLMSAENDMAIARAHVQMLVKRVRGNQYHYTGHCVTFMQNIVRAVDVLPNLPSELDIVLLQPPAGHADDPRYRRQFRTDFRVRCQHTLMWLHFLKANNHPGYGHITISTDRIAALLVDGNVSSSVYYGRYSWSRWTRRACGCPSYFRYDLRCGD
jgi:hypothetical protein